MIIFWKNCSESGPTLFDEALSYSIGCVFILIFVASVVLNLLSFTLQCLKKTTVYRILFKLLAMTDLLTSMIYPAYAAYMCIKPEPLPSFASIGKVEAMLLKLGSIPIYLSVVLTSLLSISRYIGVRDPLSVQRIQLCRDTLLIILLIGIYSVAHVVFLSFTVSQNEGSLYRGAGLTVYFWDVTLLANASHSQPVLPPNQTNVQKLTLISIILWLPAQLHCIIGFITSVATICILNSRKNKELLAGKCYGARQKKKVSQERSPKIVKARLSSILPFSETPKRQLSKCHSSPIIAKFQRKPGISPTLRLYVKTRSVSSEIASTSVVNPSGDGPNLNNRRGAVTIFLMNIGNVMWFVNFIVVLLIEFKRDFFGFVFLDSARFLGRLFIPQVLALLNPSIVILRSTDLRDSLSQHRDSCWSRFRQLTHGSIALTSEQQRVSTAVNFVVQ